jgi:hypothetical protein
MALLHVQGMRCKNLLLVKLNESARRHPDHPFEKAREMTLVYES